MNLLPGQGLGFTGSQLLGFGLGSMAVTVIPIPDKKKGSGGGYYARVYDNAYSRQDDSEIIELLSILFQVI